MLLRRRELFNTGYGGVDSHTLLCLNGSTLTDSSNYNRTMTNRSGYNVVVNNSLTDPYGTTGCLYFGTQMSCLYTPANYAWGTSNWTIDWWEYHTDSTLKYGARFYTYYNNSYGGILLGYEDGRLYVSTSYNSASNVNTWDIVLRQQMFNGLTVNQWVHYAVVRSGTTFTGYTNGVKFASCTGSGSIYNNTGAYWSIGYYNDNDKDGFIGYMKDFRISNIARWTSDFTPHHKPYSKGISRYELHS